MAMKLTEVRMNIVSLICDECGVGEMKPSGVQYLLFPPLYQHICDKCGAEKRIESPPYPRVEYESIADKIAVESILAMKNTRPLQNDSVCRIYDLNVYTIEATGKYGGGFAVIAAENQSQAVKIAKTIEDNIWNTRYDVPESVKQLPCKCVGPARVLAHFESGE